MVWPAMAAPLPLNSISKANVVGEQKDTMKDTGAKSVLSRVAWSNSVREREREGGKKRKRRTQKQDNSNSAEKRQ